MRRGAAYYFKVLDSGRTKNPCSKANLFLESGEKISVCGDCQKSVYNLNKHTKREVAKLLAGKNGEICAVFLRDSEGKICFQPSPPNSGLSCLGAGLLGIFPVLAQNVALAEEVDPTPTLAGESFVQPVESKIPNVCPSPIPSVRSAPPMGGSESGAGPSGGGFGWDEVEEYSFLRDGLPWFLFGLFAGALPGIRKRLFCQKR